jgi:hypothetical protein
MAKFTYIGDEPSVFAFGLTFPKGVFVEVTDAHALKKLPNHSHFRSAPDELPQEAPEIGAALTPEPINALMPDAPAPTRRKRAKKDT